MSSKKELPTIHKDTEEPRSKMLPVALDPPALTVGNHLPDLGKLKASLVAAISTVLDDSLSLPVGKRAAKTGTSLGAANKRVSCKL